MVVGTLRYPAFDDEELSEKVECKPFNSIVEEKIFPNQFIREKKKYFWIKKRLLK
jgi:hypothetical protein